MPCNGSARVPLRCCLAHAEERERLADMQPLRFPCAATATPRPTLPSRQTDLTLQPDFTCSVQFAVQRAGSWRVGCMRLPVDSLLAPLQSNCRRRSLAQAVRRDSAPWPSCRPWTRARGQPIVQFGNVAHLSKLRFSHIKAMMSDGSPRIVRMRLHDWGVGCHEAGLADHLEDQVPTVLAVAWQCIVFVRSICHLIAPQNALWCAVTSQCTHSAAAVIGNQVASERAVVAVGCRNERTLLGS